MKIEFDVSGDVEVRRALERQGRAGELAARRVFNRVIKRAVVVAKVLAPIGETGDLAKSVRLSSARVNRRTGEVFGFIVAGGASKLGGSGIYAGPQELGRARVGPGGAEIELHHDRGQSPFVLPPFLAEAGKAGGELLATLDQEVASAG